MFIFKSGNFLNILVFIKWGNFILRVFKYKMMGLFLNYSRSFGFLLTILF